MSAVSNAKTIVLKFSNRMEVSCGGLTEDAIQMWAKRYWVKPRKPGNRRYPSRDLDPVPPENEDGVVTTPPWQKTQEFVIITVDFTTVMCISVKLPSYFVVRMPWILAGSDSRVGRQRCPPRTGEAVGEHRQRCAEQRSGSNGWREKTETA